MQSTAYLVDPGMPSEDVVAVRDAWGPENAEGGEFSAEHACAGRSEGSMRGSGGKICHPEASPSRRVDGPKTLRTARHAARSTM